MREEDGVLAQRGVAQHRLCPWVRKDQVDVHARGRGERGSRIGSEVVGLRWPIHGIGSTQDRAHSSSGQHVDRTLVEGEPGRSRDGGIGPLLEEPFERFVAQSPLLFEMRSETGGQQGRESRRRERHRVHAYTRARDDRAEAVHGLSRDARDDVALLEDLSIAPLVAVGCLPQLIEGGGGDDQVELGSRSRLREEVGDRLDLRHDAVLRLEGRLPSGIDQGSVGCERHRGGDLGPPREQDLDLRLPRDVDRSRREDGDLMVDRFTPKCELQRIDARVLRVDASRDLRHVDRDRHFHGVPRAQRRLERHRVCGCGERRPLLERRLVLQARGHPRPDRPSDRGARDRRVPVVAHMDPQLEHRRPSLWSRASG